MMNFSPLSVEQYHSDAQRYGARTENDFKVSTFSEVHGAVRDMMLNEGLSTSESSVLTPKLDEQLNLINDLTGSYPGEVRENTIHGFSRSYKEHLLDSNQEMIQKLREQNPDSGLMTLNDILTETKDETKKTRDQAVRSMIQAEGISNLGMVTGTMRAVVEDPVILGSMVASALFTKGAGATAMSRALGVAKTEAIIGSVSEAMIQPGVYAWKKRIESPYSIQEAAFNVMIAGGLGAILGAGGSLVYDAATFRKAAKLKNVKPEEAEILNRYADDLDVKPDDVELEQHYNAIDKVTLDIEEGVMPNVDNVRERPVPAGDTVKLDGVSVRAMADIQVQKDLKDAIDIPAVQREIIDPADNLPEELKAINSQIDELRKTDFDVPIEQALDADGETVAITKKASELFDEIEADEKSLNDITNCYGGAQ